MKNGDKTKSTSAKTVCFSLALCVQSKKKGDDNLQTDTD